MPSVLCVLMWKHGVVRLRKYFNTVVDLVSPLMFFLILYAFKDKLMPRQLFRTMETSVEAHTEEIDLNFLESPDTILYHPDTPLTAGLMEKVGAQLGRERLHNFPYDHNVGYYPYARDAQLTAFTHNMTEKAAIVKFHGMDNANTWPSKLSYTIRMKRNFHTEGYDSLDDTVPHLMFGLSYNIFMRLQWAIDSSFIKTQARRSDDDFIPNVVMQEFPYYRSESNTFAKALCGLVRMICWLSLLLPFVFLMVRLLEERTSGIQELVKMVGVSMHTLGFSHYLNVLPPGLVFAVVGTAVLKSEPNALLANSSTILIALCLILYFHTIIAMAFACSYIVKGSEYAVTVSVIAYGVLWFPAWFLSDHNLPSFVRIPTGVLPHVPVYWFWTEVGVIESYGYGVNFSNMFSSHSRFSGSVFLSLVFMLFQTVFYFFVAWYLSLVRPGEYGQPLPWNFIFKRQFWRRNNVTPDIEFGSTDSEELMSEEDLYFERAPDNLDVGIKIDNVSKVYGQHVALRDVSLNVYQGEITVLLGHNGAGKTTLMSIISGMTNATKGKVFVKGFDTVTQQEQVRKQIGLCPQHNMFFSDLTLQQHIMFFTMLKKGSRSDAKKSSQKLAVQLGLQHKLGVLCSALSGGMKRRAQLACALAGDADVLILDEPTSGLDVETRRELWDLLHLLRGTRTVLLSTHFMEEADVLGDRVAALHAGKLRCFATTMHLKKALGDGYRLSLTTVGPPKEKEITRQILKHVHNATVKDHTMNSISYNLPGSTKNFSKLFEALESKRTELGIDSIGLGVSTLEEVFLKLCSDVDTTVMEDEAENAAPDLIQTTLSGAPLFFRQFAVLFKRQIMFAFYRKWIFLILQVIIPIVMIFLITKQCNNALVEKQSGAIKMDLDMYANMPDKRALYNLQTEEGLRSRPLEEKYPDVRFERAKDVADTVLRISKADKLEYNKYLVGVELTPNKTKFLYTTTLRHAAPVALNILSNLLARRYVTQPMVQIQTYNHPIEGYIREEVVREPKHMDLAVLWTIFVVFFIQATVLHCVSLPCRERETGSRHAHVMSGCSPELHWAVTLTFHVTLTLLFLIAPTVIAIILFEKDGTFDQPDFILSLVVLLTLGTMALLAFMYLMSLMFKEKYANLILVAFLFVFGLVLPLMKFGYDTVQASFGGTDKGMMHYFLELCWLMAPMYTLAVATLRCVKVARFNAWCVVLGRQCPSVFVNEAEWNAQTQERCCAVKRAMEYFSLDDNSPLNGIIMIAIQFTVLMLIVILTQRGIFNGLFDWLLNLRYMSPPGQDHDPMVRAERTYVEKEIAKPVYGIKNDAILVHDVHKNYKSLIGKGVNAVKGVSFSVKKGECFGLLGVNGAGKTTTFKMLTAEECPTRGRIYSNGQHLTRGNSKYLQTLGYCPQFFGLDMFLTGRQNLTLILTLRGYNRDQVANEVNTWIDIVGLSRYADHRVESYSGGCMRRLSAAAALCGGSATVLLDEPSAGVDVAARRRLWAAMRKALKQGRSIVITSHSLDEIEALCSRIAIMCAGRVRALGSAQALRATLGQGHAVVFKIQNVRGDEVDGPLSEVTKLKEKMATTFKCDLKDKHKTMLHFHINETMRYSELFFKLEKLKDEFMFIEDYSVTETTLEEVFLSLAKAAENV